MAVFNVHDAKTRLSQLLTAVERGEDVVIARQGVPVARLVAIPAASRAEPGAWQSLPGWDRYVFDASAVAPMTEQEMAAEGWPV